MSTMKHLDRLVLDAVQLRGPLAQVTKHIWPYVAERRNMWLFSIAGIYASLYRMERWGWITSTFLYMPEPRIRAYSSVLQAYTPDQEFFYLTYSTDDGTKHPVGIYNDMALANAVADAGAYAGHKRNFYTIHTVTAQDYWFQNWLPVLGINNMTVYRRDLLHSVKEGREISQFLSKSDK